MQNKDLFISRRCDIDYQPNPDKIFINTLCSKQLLRDMYYKTLLIPNIPASFPANDKGFNISLEGHIKRDIYYIRFQQNNNEEDDVVIRISGNTKSSKCFTTSVVSCPKNIDVQLSDDIINLKLNNNTYYYGFTKQCFANIITDLQSQYSSSFINQCKTRYDYSKTIRLVLVCWEKYTLYITTFHLFKYVKATANPLHDLLFASPFFAILTASMLCSHCCEYSNLPIIYYNAGPQELKANILLATFTLISSYYCAEFFGNSILKNSILGFGFYALIVNHAPTYSAMASLCSLESYTDRHFHYFGTTIGVDRTHNAIHHYNIKNEEEYKNTFINCAAKL